MVQFSLLAFMVFVNAPDYALTDAIQLMQERKPVMAASQEEDTFKPYNINLNADIQKYIWEQSKKYNISFELLLAIAYTESRFDSSVVSWDGSSTGLFQINTSNTVQWLARETEIKNVDPKNPYHSAKMAAWYVNYLHEKYLKEGYDGELVTKRLLLAYRYGIGKSKKKSLNNTYVDAVLDYKYKLESGEVGAYSVGGE